MHFGAPVAQVWLLVDSDRLIGAINIAMYADQSAHLYYLAVKPAEAIKGFGKQLMGFAQEHLRQLGCSGDTLVVRDRQAKVALG